MLYIRLVNVVGLLGNSCLLDRGGWYAFSIGTHLLFLSWLQQQTELVFISTKMNT
jgi:hypothetical protein